MRLPPGTTVSFDEKEVPPANADGVRECIPDHVRVRVERTSGPSGPPPDKERKRKRRFRKPTADETKLIGHTVFWITVSIVIEKVW